MRPVLSSFPASDAHTCPDAEAAARFCLPKLTSCFPPAPLWSPLATDQDLTESSPWPPGRICICIQFVDQRGAATGKGLGCLASVPLASVVRGGAALCWRNPQYRPMNKTWPLLVLKGHFCFPVWIRRCVAVYMQTFPFEVISVCFHAFITLEHVLARNQMGWALAHNHTQQQQQQQMSCLRRSQRNPEARTVYIFKTFLLICADTRSLWPAMTQTLTKKKSSPLAQTAVNATSVRK